MDITVPTLLSMLQNLRSSLPNVQKLIFAFCYVSGMGFIMKGIWSLKVYGESRAMMSSNTNLKEPITILAVGIVLIYLPTGLDIVMQTMFGYTTPTVMSYHQPTSYLKAANDSVTAFIRIIGLIAFIKGFFMLAKGQAAAQQGGGLGKALTRIIGGILAINIVGTKDIIWNTLGLVTGG